MVQFSQKPTVSKTYLFYGLFENVAIYCFIKNTINLKKTKWVKNIAFVAQMFSNPFKTMKPLGEYETLCLGIVWNATT